MKEEREEFTHPSYGKVRLGRGSWNGAKFYGSELPQDHYMYIEIDESEWQRDLTDDKYYAGKNIIKIRMTPNQFSEMLTSMNSEGVPCTIERRDGVMIEELPSQTSRKEFVHNKFKQRMNEFASTLLEKQTRAKKLVAKKTLSKDDQSELTNVIDQAIQEIKINIPFFMETFQETADKIVVEAQAAVEAAIMHKINVLGLKELQKQNKLLNQENNEKDILDPRVIPMFSVM